MSEAASLTTTIMFADICGSTSLYTRQGDLKAAELINDALEQASAIVKENCGVVLRTMGDDVLCIFSNSLDAVQCALKLHQWSRSNSFEKGFDLLLRIGINSGPAILSEDDVHGDTVNVAARLAAFAKAEQTILSTHTVSMLDNRASFLIRPLGEFSLKGKPAPLLIYEVLDSNDPDEITQIGSSSLQFPKASRLQISYQSGKHKLDYLLSQFLLGRSPDCQLTVDHPLVSRHHAEIRYANNEFILADRSTNGTLILTHGRLRTLHHSEAALRGSGSIYLGRTNYDKKFEISFQASGGSRAIRP